MFTFSTALVHQGRAVRLGAGRYLLRDLLSGLLVAKSKRWETEDKAIEMEGWKLLVLLRLSPLIPYNLLNITMAATKIPFWAFATASCFGAALMRHWLVPLRLHLVHRCCAWCTSDAV